MSITLGDISVRYVNLLLDTAESLGQSSHAIQQQFNLSENLLGQPHGRISIPKFMRIGHEVIKAANYPQLGLEMAKRSSLSLMGITGFCAACAPTLRQAITDIIRFEALSSKNIRGHSSFYQEQKKAIVAFYSISPYNDFNRFVVDLALAVQCQFIRALSAGNALPKLVQIEFAPPAHVEHYETFFPCPVKFNQPRNALTYEQNVLNISPAMHNQVAYAECVAVCERQLHDAQKQFSFQERVMNEISVLLQTPELAIDQVANRLDMPSWTLRRKLKAEHTSFTALVDNTRQALAYIYLKDQQYSVNEVAYLLGFSYPNAFQRAFKRWEGIPPGEYRALTE